MAKPTGFLEYDRQGPTKRPKSERLKDFREVEQPLSYEDIRTQAARCMDCGIPFCHGTGCPVQNLIPDFNDMVYRGQWKKALALLHTQNNFPEITGRVCPAPCETSCTLGINRPAVSIRQIELQTVEYGWEQGWIAPQPPNALSGYKVAVAGSGPAGLAAAQQLARKGHRVTVYEKDPRPGGILRYGIPDFKLEKWVLDRRLEQMVKEGVTFETDVTIGKDISMRYLQKSFDAVLLSGGARVPRDLPIPGRELEGIDFAMDFLVQQNKRNNAESIEDEHEIYVQDKNVVVIGGGDTGADCVGTANRQGARSVTQVEIMEQPPEQRHPSTPWPEWPYQLRTSTSHEEGCERMWCVMTKSFEGQEGHVTTLNCVRVEWETDPETGKSTFREVPGSEFTLPAEQILLAMGFTNEGNAETLTEYGVDTDERGQAQVDKNLMSNAPGIFVAGDLSKGASLVVRAISDGRNAAEGIDNYLKTE